MPIVTLTTDFGNQDYYLAVIKGAILCQKPDANLVDITHNIPNYLYSFKTFCASSAEILGPKVLTTFEQAKLASFALPA